MFQRRTLDRFCFGFAWTVAGCASIRDSYLATPVDEQGHVSEHHRTKSGLIISGQELTDYASRHFGMLQVTLENRSSQWLRISRLALDFGGPEQNAGVALPAGSDIDAWYTATLQRNDIRETNSAALLAGLLLVGETTALVGAASGQRSLAAAGAATALGALTVGTLEGYRDPIASAERVGHLPGSHLLALPFAVPPGLFAKRWVLLNTRDSRTPCIRQMLLDYDVQGGDVQGRDLQIDAPGPPGRQQSAPNSSRERVLLAFREPGDSSEWQRSACYIERERGWLAQPDPPSTIATRMTASTNAEIMAMR